MLLTPRGWADSFPGATYFYCAIVANASGTAFGSMLSFTTLQPALQSVVSRKVHGPVGAFDLALDPAASFSGPMTIEPRANGSAHIIVFQFSSPITTEGSVRVSDVADQTLGFAQLSHNTNDVIVTLYGIPDNQRLKIALTGVNGILDASVTLGFFVGDVNRCAAFCSGPGRINAADISTGKAQVPQAVTAFNFRYDFNLDGVLDSRDILLSKARSGRTLN